jgi:hypothetical protein
VELALPQNALPPKAIHAAQQLLARFSPAVCERQSDDWKSRFWMAVPVQEPIIVQGEEDGPEARQEHERSQVEIAAVKVVRMNDIRRRTRQFKHAMAIGKIEVVHTHRAAQAFGDRLLPRRVVPMIEVRTGEDRQDVRIVGLLVADDQPRFDSHATITLKQAPRDALGATSNIRGVDRNDLVHRGLGSQAPRLRE